MSAADDAMARRAAASRAGDEASRRQLFAALAETEALIVVLDAEAAINAEERLDDPEGDGA